MSTATTDEKKRRILVLNQDLMNDLDDLAAMENRSWNNYVSIALASAVEGHREKIDKWRKEKK
jgi:hypothetical protein